LHQKGFSLSGILSRLSIPKNTVSGWVKAVRLTTAQKLKIKEKIAAGGSKDRRRAKEVIKAKTDGWKEEIRAKTTDYIKDVYRNRKIEKLICGILYLGEGAKYPSTRHLVFANSNPQIIKLFLTLLRKNFLLDNKKFRCRIMQR
jgi:wobble nucleotide-excising tRNase